MSETPKVKIIHKKGRTLRLLFDYGVIKNVTFPEGRTTEEIREEIKDMYKKYKAKPKAINIEEVDWTDEE